MRCDEPKERVTKRGKSKGKSERCSRRQQKRQKRERQATRGAERRRALWVAQQQRRAVAKHWRAYDLQMEDFRSGLLGRRPSAAYGMEVLAWMIQ